MSNFFEELKKRNVYKTATAYAVTSWLILQIVDVVGPGLGWDETFTTLLLKILLVGFPIALVLAWLYELTPKGFKRTGTYQEETVDNRKAGRRLNYFIIGILSIAVCLLVADRVLFSESPTNNQQASIAVLPFDFLSTADSLAFMSKAMSRAISDRLGNVSGLVVIAQTSSSQFGKDGGDVREIGQKLGANYLMEGDLRLEGNRLQLSTRLINTTTGRVQWQKQYDQNFETIMTLEEDLADNVVKEIGVEVFPDEFLRLTGSITPNPEAYKLYLQAVELGKLRNEKSLKRAIELMEKAISLEPEFAKAHAQMVDLYMLSHGYGDLDFQTMQGKMQEHLKKAVDANPNIPEVYYAIAAFSGSIEKDTSKAIANYRKAIELNPSFSDAFYRIYVLLQFGTGKNTAIKSILKAYELDPYNDFLSSMVAQTYNYELDDFNSGMEVLNKVLAKDSMANFCSRIKSGFVSGPPFGDLVQGFILVHNAMKNDPYDAGNLGWAIAYCKDLDLLPLAERYSKIRELKFPYSFWTYNDRYLLNAYKRNYRDNLDLVKIWSSEKVDITEKEKISVLASTYVLMGQYQEAKDLIDSIYPNMEERWRNLPPNDYNVYNPMPATPHQFGNEIHNYLMIYRAMGSEEKAAILAEKLCEIDDQIFNSRTLQTTGIKDLYSFHCYYYKQDLDSMIQLMDKMWFENKNRHRLKVFEKIRNGFFQAYEDDPRYIEFSERVTEETHRMRAEVIEYLKEEGDWDPAWDKELGLDGSWQLAVGSRMRRSRL